MNLNIEMWKPNSRDAQGKFILMPQNIAYYLLIGSIGDLPISVAVMANAIEGSINVQEAKGLHYISEETILFFIIAGERFPNKRIVDKSPQYASLEKDYLYIKHEYDVLVDALQSLIAVLPKSKKGE